MDRLEERHIDFLRTCATEPNRIHPLTENINVIEAEDLVREGLLIKYVRVDGTKYAIARYGAQYVKELYGSNDSPDLKKLAIDFVITKGYSEANAIELVEQVGANAILKSQADEMRQNSQREVTIPLNEQGKPEIKYKG